VMGDGFCIYSSVYSMNESRIRLGLFVFLPVTCRENILPNPKRRTRSVHPSHPLPPSATSPHPFPPTLSLRSSHDMALTLVTILLFYFIFIDRAAVPFPES
jgi:hypothetical protein